MMTQLTQTQRRSPSTALNGEEWERWHREQRSRYLSPHDQAVLEQAQEWEARQRQMYPISN